LGVDSVGPILGPRNESTLGEKKEVLRTPERSDFDRSGTAVLSTEVRTAEIRQNKEKNPTKP